MTESMTADPMPVFTIKAKDRLAYNAIRFYARLCEDYGLHDQAEEVLKALREMREWQERNPLRMQFPDHPHVAVHLPDEDVIP